MKVWVAIPMRHNYSYHTDKDCHRLDGSEVDDRDAHDLPNKQLCTYCSGENERNENPDKGLRARLEDGEIDNPNYEQEERG